MKGTRREKTARRDASRTGESARDGDRGNVLVERRPSEETESAGECDDVDRDGRGGADGRPRARIERVG